MFKNLIPCSCLLVLSLSTVAAQETIPTSYKSVRAATMFTGEASSNLSQVQLYLSPTSENDHEGEAFILEEIAKSVERLEHQKVGRKKQKKALELIRHEVETKYLRHFEGLADFSALFRDSRYNDITAAALISILLRELNMDHQLLLYQQQPRIELTDGTTLDIEHWGHNRPNAQDRDAEQSYLIEVLHALQVRPESQLYRNSLMPYRAVSPKRPLLPAELTGMLYYRRALDFYEKRQMAAAAAALDRARTYFSDPKLELVRYAILFQQAGEKNPDSTLVAPLFELYRLHPSSEISLELVRRFAQMAEYYLLDKKDPYGFENLYADYRGLFAAKKLVLQQLKEIYFVEMAQFYARRFEPKQVISYLDSLNTYRPNDPQIQNILTPLLVRSISNQKDPEQGMNLIETYRRDFPFLRSHALFKDMELCYRAERTRRAFDAELEAKGRSFLEAFEQQLAQAGNTPRCNLWITTAYYSASAYYFRKADYPNARWFIQRALALVPGDHFLLHRQEVLRNY